MSSAGLNTLFRHAQNLPNDLATLRESNKNHSLPFIFVAHSVGGLVVKDALNYSAETGHKRLKEIVSSTFGICFLGTPHRESKSASLGRTLFRVTEIVAAQRANTQLLQTFIGILNLQIDCICTTLGALVLTEPGEVSETDRLSIARVLLQNGDDPNYKPATRSWEFGVSFMEICARYRTIECVKLLDEFGARWPIPYDTNVQLLSQQNPVGSYHHQVWSQLGGV